MNRPTAALTALTLAALLAGPGCGRIGSGIGSGDSGLNPLRWFGGARPPDLLEPEGGYAARGDARPSIPAVTGAGWQPLGDGRMLVVTGIGASKGFWDAGLVPEAFQPAGPLRPDADGVLRLRMVARPPALGTPDSLRAADPAVDTITTAVTLPAATLARIRRIDIAGRANGLTLTP